MRNVLVCAAALCGLALSARADDWPQWMGPYRDGVWHEKGIVEKLPAKMSAKWRTPISGGYAGPSVAGGKVFVHDFKTDGDVAGQSDPKRPAKPLKGKERVLCLDATTGKELWKQEYAVETRISYPAGPRATPTVEGGRVYALGMAGHLCCLDVADGKPVWEKELVKEYGMKEPPLWGFCSHPLIVGDRLYLVVGGKGSTCVCLDKKTGKEVWRALDVYEPGYSRPEVRELGGKKRLVVWTPEGVNALDIDTGKVVWSVELKPKYEMSIMAPIQSGDHLFAGGIGEASALIKIDGDKAEVVKRGNRSTYVHPVNMTPLLDGETIYGTDTYGAFMAVDLKSGKRLWQTFEPTVGGMGVNSATAFLVKNGPRHFLFNEKGELIIAKLSREKYEEVSRAKLIAPTATAFGRSVVWSCPAFAGRCVFVRNDKEIACFSLAE